MERTENELIAMTSLVQDQIHYMMGVDLQIHSWSRLVHQW